MTFTEEFKRAQARENERVQKLLNQPTQDVYSKPEPPPLMSELYERLSHTREGLRAGVNRVHAFNNRILGAVPEPASGTKGNETAAPCSGDALRDLVHEIAMLTEELLGCASRIERIG